jgi:hypothetical protein
MKLPGSSIIKLLKKSEKISSISFWDFFERDKGQSPAEPKQRKLKI